MSFKLYVKRLSPAATLPSRASPGAAGYDLASAVSTVVPARGKALVPTDLSIALPPGTYGRIAPRSGLAWKHSIDVGAGVIDSDYRGNVGVVLFNFSDKDFEIKPGDRIAQLIIEKIETPEVAEVDDLDATQRDAGGFGSTGIASGPDAVMNGTGAAERRRRGEPGEGEGASGQLVTLRSVILRQENATHASTPSH